jgi:hypothetical protein
MFIIVIYQKNMRILKAKTQEDTEKLSEKDYLTYLLIKEIDEQKLGSQNQFSEGEPEPPTKNCERFQIFWLKTLMPVLVMGFSFLNMNFLSFSSGNLRYLRLFRLTMFIIIFDFVTYLSYFRFKAL